MSKQLYADSDCDVKESKVAHETAILDFGSSKITVLIGERGVNDTINVKGFGASKYAGFGNGEWVNPEELGAAISKAITTAESNSGIKITHLYVGVPGEFSAVECREVNIALPKRRKITDNDVLELMDAGDDFDQNMAEVINIQPIYYNLDNDRRVLQPVGIISSKLGGVLSYITAEVRFTGFIRKILTDMGITSIEYVSSVLAESLLLFDETDRDNTAILIDVGYFTTSVAVVRGDGILSLGSFSLGGAHITADLAEALGISFADAEQLKRKVILSINAGENDIYEIGSDDTVKSLSASLVNEIVIHRIFVIGKMIEKCLALCKYETPDYVPYSLTGGGISYIRGAKDVLAQKLGRNVEIVVPKLPQVNKPDMSSSWGLLDMAIKNEAPVKMSFFERLAAFFRK